MTVRCLIVDDNDRFLQVAPVMLEREGIDVVGVAATSAEAIQRAGELRPDVALADVDLGAECGFDLAWWFARAGSVERMDVIMISARDEADYRDMIAVSPCLGYRPKTGLSGSAIRAKLENAEPAD